MRNLEMVEAKGTRVLTSKQIAAMYETTEDRIRQNYHANRKKYVEGKHYILLTGNELKAFKNQVGISDLVDKRASHLTLWTEKGALLHAKSLNTDKAWEAYEWLMDFYFRAKEVIAQKSAEPKKTTSKKLLNEALLDIPNNKEIQDKAKRIHNYCIAMQCMLELYNRYIDAESAKSLQKALDSIGAEICIETFRLKNIEVGLKPR